LGHRVILRPESRLRKVTTAALLHEIVSEVRVPVVGRAGEKDDFPDR
jgi:MoxR-like ATPase